MCMYPLMYLYIYIHMSLCIYIYIYDIHVIYVYFNMAEDSLTDIFALLGQDEPDNCATGWVFFRTTSLVSLTGNGGLVGVTIPK